MSLAGCSLGEFDASERACPCAANYVCDEARNVCVTGLPTASDGGTTDGVLRDAGFATPPPRDAGGRPAPADAGAETSDAGAPPIDAGTIDAGVEPPRLVVEPAMLALTATISGTIVVRNGGGGTLRIVQLDWVDTTTASADDFIVDACAPPACDPQIALGPGEEVAFGVAFVNDDASLQDRATLRLETADGQSADVVLTGTGPENCAPPSPVVQIRVAGGTTIAISAAGSDPGGAPIVSYRWTWLQAPAVPPAFSPPDAADTVIQITGVGTYQPQVELTNGCGARAVGAGGTFRVQGR